jgi:DNA-binding NarL/FixJ family response regulator
VIRVLVSASSAIVRAGLDALVRGHEGFESVGTVIARAELTEALAARQPDVVLLQLDAEDAEGVEDVLLPSSGGGSSPAFVLLVGEARPVWTVRALRAGAAAVLPADATAEEIVAAVTAVSTGLLVLDGGMASALIDSRSATVRSAPRSAAPGLPASLEQPLTAREIEVLGMLAEGLGNKEIAARLSISGHTVKFHITAIFAKLGVRSRTEAVTVGIRRGVIMV